MYKTSLPLLAVACSLALTAPAQENPEKKQKKERKEIIIRADEKGDKTVIEIDGDKVTVNGKEVNGSDKETIIMKRSTPNGRVLIVEGDSLNMPEPFTLRDGKPEVRIFRGDRSWNQTESRAQLGVRLQAHEKGVEVMEVTEPSAAATAGIRVMDIITSVDGKRMAKPEEMVEYIRSKKPGDKVELGILREGKDLSVSATLGEMKTVSEFRTFEMPMGPDMRQSIEEMMEQGPGRVIIREPARRQRMGLSVEEQESGSGLTILDVTPGSPAQKAGVRKGDVLMSIDGRSLSTVDDVRNALKGEPRDLDISVQRDGRRQTLKVKMKPLRQADF